ncbi:MAG: endolytic transglycosylase MltG [Rhodospirillaceae bacterium]
MKRFFAVCGLAVVLGLASIGGGWMWLQNQVQSPGPLKNSKEVVIAAGAGLGQIATQLQRDGIIDSDLVFRIQARITGLAGQLKAGEYRFSAGASVSQILAKIVAHDVIVRFLTIPEGLTSSQILQLVESADGLTGPAPSNIPDGTLLPETYGYERGETRAALVQRMAAAMSQALEDLWLGRAADLPFDSPQEALILASIVERETSVPSERARVAAVFVNRLNRGMRLQSDPTVAYGVDPSGPLGRPLRRSDLDRETPYNTYQIPGLPSGPICHPGRESIAAVLSPAQTDDLFFVADGSGGHAFAKTLREHNRNVAAWRRIQRERGDR